MEAPVAETPCVIGKGITIRGNLTGSEELVIEGTVEGQIQLKNHLTIQATGRITADISVESLSVLGRVSGNIDAVELVSLSAEASVVADIRAPRVVLEDGARFKGRIEMDVDLPPGI
jgi:cytoskeletal protein CcmA (bactofilin family)